MPFFVHGVGERSAHDDAALVLERAEAGEVGVGVGGAAFDSVLDGGDEGGEGLHGAAVYREAEKSRRVRTAVTPLTGSNRRAKSPAGRLADFETRAARPWRLVSGTSAPFLGTNIRHDRVFAAQGSRVCARGS